MGGGLGLDNEHPNIPSNSEAELLFVELLGDGEDGDIVIVAGLLEEENMVTEGVAFAGCRLDGKEVVFAVEE